MRTKVKICCIKSIEEAHAAIEFGASALGLVSTMPSGPGIVDEAVIAQIARSVPPPIATFLLTSAVDSEEIVAQQRRCGTNTLQLCDHLPPSTYPTIRNALPGIKLVQVVHVEDMESVDYAVSAAEHVDALLLDSGRLSAPIKELGGTGRTHDWGLSRKIRDAIKIPLFLAGGLTEENVAEAIRLVEPFGIDLCSSVRTADSLDFEKLGAFFAAIPNAPNKAAHTNPLPESRFK
ncbi:phosphoribosylanthranilate isomerase [Rubellicoccus peritrichatus]|uniref:N-(5'-phosphoribosyl)anthranilate isomerase n=1 Tax=Rubellicoccus peritrichatus TaxID=3080537 RepID=A0AAQ3LFK6_9BACT|nr:phosphoribosylanthranilate isomerase [Puniceicoccus sp. CR14]WOO41134.1 phosphoribosylanthranilate isomerase [Puniceicoccus sp. CR14]